MNLPIKVESAGERTSDTPAQRPGAEGFFLSGDLFPSRLPPKRQHATAYSSAAFPFGRTRRRKEANMER
jgi:hypothetical protein